MIKRIRKPFILSMLSCLLISNIGINKTSVIANATNNIPNTSTSSNIAKGADIGWVSQLEDMGIKWVSDNGNVDDPIKLLKDKGIDSVRLRVFVDPPSDYTWTKNDGTVCYLGYSNKDSVVSMAKRAKELDMKVMIDFHYSDHFADPAYQDKPEAWENHTFNELKEDVYNHTTEVMTALASEGIYPEWVQVGNETNSGMLWDDGYIWDGSSTPNVASWSQLINEGYSAVKNISPSSKVILHLAHGYDNSLFRSVFDALKGAGTNYDVIGMSYYPYWEGSEYTESINDIIYNLNDMSSRYDKDVMICEIGGLE
ncbi:MAG: glycosyl hydrolase 53 family protein, partial [Clostridium perfringens]|nr:glycosyl hydrolase 53 family protein [Clostridium perfringens]